ncbi:MAG TPA: hypothetical protein DCE23_00065 [Firmicutes bacterium]|nr:hypothetical protein [Bacillota bacterium]
MASYTGQNGDVDVTYSCDTEGIGYSIITDDIRGDFGFLINELPSALREVDSTLAKAASITDGFDFDGLRDISSAYQEVRSDINQTIGLLKKLHSAFMLDIDNVNAELQNNYGWVIGGHLDKKESKREEK